MWSTRVVFAFSNAEAKKGLLREIQQKGGKQKTVRWFMMLCKKNRGEILRKAKEERHKGKAVDGECIPLQ